MLKFWQLGEYWQMCSEWILSILSESVNGNDGDAGHI